MTNKEGIKLLKYIGDRLKDFGFECSEMDTKHISGNVEEYSITCTPPEMDIDELIIGMSLRRDGKLYEKRIDFSMVRDWDECEEYMEFTCDSKACALHHDNAETVEEMGHPFERIRGIYHQTARHEGLDRIELSVNYFKKEKQYSEVDLRAVSRKQRLRFARTD